MEALAFVSYGLRQAVFIKWLERLLGVLDTCPGTYQGSETVIATFFTYYLPIQKYIHNFVLTKNVEIYNF